MSQAPTGGGPFLKASDLQGVETVIIKTEADWTDSSFTNSDGTKKQQYVCEVQRGEEDQRLKLTVASCQEIAPVYGKDSKDWIGKSITVESVNVMVGSKMRQSIFAKPIGQPVAAAAPVLDADGNEVPWDE